MTKTKRAKSQRQTWLCYSISARNRTYIGKTYDFSRRLRQHNGEISGGARSTSALKGQWVPIFCVRGLPTERSALQLEWRLKNPMGKRRKYRKRFQGIAGRLRALVHVLRLDSWTRTAPPSRSVPLRVEVCRGVRQHLWRALDGKALPPHIEIVEIADFT